MTVTGSVNASTRIHSKDWVPKASVYVVPMKTPDDVSGLDELLQRGSICASDVVAMVAKADGTGLADDPQRGIVEQTLRAWMIRVIPSLADEPYQDIPVIVSAGCPRPLIPNVTIFTQRWLCRNQFNDSLVDGLVIGTATMPIILSKDIGRLEHIRVATQATLAAMAYAGITDPAQVRAVVAKGPSLSQHDIDYANDRGIDLVTYELSMGPNGCVSIANDAVALGIGYALDELPSASKIFASGSFRRDRTLSSTRAFVSSAGEKRNGDVVVLGMRSDTVSNVRVGLGMSGWTGDSQGLLDALVDAGLDLDSEAISGYPSQVIQAFAKYSAPIRVDGLPQLERAMLNSQTQMPYPSLGDAQAGKHTDKSWDPSDHVKAKAVGAGMIATATGLVATFVSGGEHTCHNGPEGGGPVAVFVRTPLAVSTDQLGETS